jgi:hypothetical protein
MMDVMVCLSCGKLWPGSYRWQAAQEEALDDDEPDSAEDAPMVMPRKQETRTKNNKKRWMTIKEGQQQEGISARRAFVV